MLLFLLLNSRALAGIVLPMETTKGMVEPPPTVTIAKSLSSYCVTCVSHTLRMFNNCRSYFSSTIGLLVEVILLMETSEERAGMEFLLLLILNNKYYRGSSATSLDRNQISVWDGMLETFIDDVCFNLYVDPVCDP
uniref:Uncharacterized protein n=1 Tax=Nelumbo nucifera TaxID=4432 RepID=A0A822Y4V1_NELNU|nr:TPA_asm: hypothetical protein HUJ06_027724 [Nelumbo nucifera]